MLKSYERILGLTSTAFIAIGLLTGCNPPLPPEALAAQAEGTFTCVEGDVKTSFSPEVSDGSQYLSDNLSANCPGSTLILESARNSEVVASSVSLDGPSSEPYAVVPYAVESGVFVITSSSGASAILSPGTIQGILDGSITEWTDPAIQADNGGTSPLEGKITLISISQKEAVDSLKTWYKHYTSSDLKTSFDTTKKVSLLDYQNLPEGSLAFMPGAIYTELSNVAAVTPAAVSLLVDVTNFPSGATPDMLSVQSASSQWSVKKSSTVLSVEMNFSAKPVPPAGFDVAPAPYQIIYPVNLSLFGKDSLKARAAARYLLRQDSQGSLTLVASLPVSVRGESIAFVSKGLPEPVATDVPTN